jgi:AraC-like DNA-binding protein
MPPFLPEMHQIQFNYQNKEPIEAIFHSHSFYEIYYFHSGACTYLIGDRIYSLQPGDLILMNGMTLHCPKIDPSLEYVRSTFHFYPADLEPLTVTDKGLNVLEPFQQFGNYRLMLRGEEWQKMERRLGEMKELYDREDPVGKSRFRLAFYDLLYVIYEHCRQPLQERIELPQEKEKTVQRVISFLEERYMDELSMNDIQAHLHVSKYYLSKLFKEVTGVTIFDFLYQRRINQARIHFMLDPKVSVTEVCFQLGFKHLAHFSRMFKDQVGVTPEQYKKHLPLMV